MSRAVIAFLGATLLLGQPLVPARAQNSFGNLTKRIPANANALLLFNVEKLHQSPLAQREKWRENHENVFAAGITMLPPDAEKFILASQMDLEFVQPIWQTALLDLSYNVSIPKIAAKRGGAVDRIADRDAASLPGDIYVVQFAPQLVGAMAPANRQAVANWIRDVYADTIAPLSPYLNEAVGFAEQVGTPIILALDLTDAVPPERIVRRIPEFKCLEGRTIDEAQWSRALASVRGVTLGITVSDKSYGKIKVDFAEDVSVIGDAAKPLLLEILAKQGAMIDEFNDWTAKVESHQISIEGPLYRSGMQRIFSLLDAPPPLQTASHSANPEQQTADAQRLASQQYFKTVSSYIDDLRGKRQSTEFVTNGQVGLWFERYARKIDQLPILNVDEELIDWGAFVAESLRQAETSMKKIGANTRVREVNAPTYYNVQTFGVAGYQSGAYGRWGRSGYYGGWVATEDLTAEQRERTRIRTEESISGNASANELMQRVQQSIGDVRRSMTKKYMVEF